MGLYICWRNTGRLDSFVLSLKVSAVSAPLLADWIYGVVALYKASDYFSTLMSAESPSGNVQ